MVLIKQKAIRSTTKLLGLQTYDWKTFSCLWRLFRASSAADQYYTRSWQSPIAGVFFPEDESAQIVINLGTLKLFLTRPEYTELEGRFWRWFQPRASRRYRTD